ncbi:hypothetical protein SH580_07305 [Coraliomargarita algicola]|uniref:Uncharacterized protein n=1 Tax=Coraliomargarita algicola TaxID=3092156 RepID=A0ABZ0RMR4_9BACT|nr:hypothetical protein [Coraliomargarita sp. J2-16]WPJ97515.1 hypothetical protein SH580_07305 [Coraliomargarita sp. J2-16]
MLSFLFLVLSIDTIKITVMWFDELEKIENPGAKELLLFVEQTRRFLGDVVKDDRFWWLWMDYQGLREQAYNTYQNFIVEGPGLEIDSVIMDLDPLPLNRHGLIGSPLRFKFSVIAQLDRELTSFLPDFASDELDSKSFKKVVRNWFGLREWFKKLVTAIDATLDSILKCADLVLPGAGGIIKEFKDTIVSIA